jgi:hypothetical protein
MQDQVRIADGQRLTTMRPTADSPLLADAVEKGGF